MTEAGETVSVLVNRWAGLRRAFRPLALGLLASAALLTWDAYRRTTIHFHVSIDMGVLQAPAATIDEEQFLPGQWVKPGHRKLVVSATDADPIEQEFFVWPGIHDLGEFHLRRSKGAVTVSITPSPLDVVIKGEFLTNSSKSTFPHSHEERPVEVVRNQTTNLDWKANVGSLGLSSVPSAADFNLLGWFGEEIRQKGKTPSVVEQLPVGQYVLEVSREGYRKELRVDVKPGETNEIRVAFEYAEVSVATDPAGATIFLNSKESGQTPKTISELRPGRYEVRLEKEGFVPAATSLQVKGNESITIATNLTSRAYVAAMENARKLGNAVPADYERALQALEEALKIRPGDAEATALKDSLLRAQAKAVVDKQADEIAARRHVVLDAFKRATDGELDAAAFDIYSWSFSTSVERLKEAVLRSFQREPVQWVFKSETKQSDHSILLVCTRKSGNTQIVAKYSHCSLLLTQFSAEEVILHAKFWAYTPRPGTDMPSWIWTKAETIPYKSQAIAEDFKKRLEMELK
jgi:hypothetical protein